jgi:hypothetical protein
MGAPGSRRSLGSTGTAAGGGHGAWTLLEAGWLGARPGGGPWRRDHHSGAPSPSKCRGARWSRGGAPAAAPSWRCIPSPAPGAGRVPGRREPRRIGALPASWPMPSGPLSRVVVGSPGVPRTLSGYERAAARKPRGSQTAGALPRGDGTSDSGCRRRCCRGARRLRRPGGGPCWIWPRPRRTPRWGPRSRGSGCARPSAAAGSRPKQGSRASRPWLSRGPRAPPPRRRPLGRACGPVGGCSPSPCRPGAHRSARCCALWRRPRARGRAQRRSRLCCLSLGVAGQGRPGAGPQRPRPGPSATINGGARTAGALLARSTGAKVAWW